MKYTLFALGVVVLALIGLALYWRRRQQNKTLSGPVEKPLKLTPGAQLYQLKKSEKFWGVSVESHCAASSRLAGQPFPYDSAPRLPVKGCDASACICSYIGLPERRKLAQRRRGVDRRTAVRMEGSERRAERPRRENDLVSWGAYRHL